MPAISEIDIEEIINSPEVPYSLLQAIGQEIAERKKRDNFILGDIAIRLCGEAVIGRPSNDETNIMRDFAGDIGISIRALQEYRQMATFYNVHMREDYSHASYSVMREAMRQSITLDGGSHTVALHILNLALGDGLSVDAMRAIASNGDPPEEMFLSELFKKLGNVPVKVKLTKTGEYVIRTKT